MPKEDTQTVTICHGLVDKVANVLRWIIFRCWLMSIGATVGGLIFLDGNIEVKRDNQESTGITPVANASENQPYAYDVELDESDLVSVKIFL